MGINDPISLFYLDKRETYVLGKRSKYTGNTELFYDNESALIEFETADEAIDFARDSLGVYPELPKDMLDGMIERRMEVVKYVAALYRADRTLNKMQMIDLAYKAHPVMKGHTFEMSVVVDRAIVMVEKGEGDQLAGLPLFQDD